MALLLAAVVALVPLLILPGFSFYYDVTPKIVVLLAGTAAALPWMKWRGACSTREGRWFSTLLAAQALSLALSTAFSIQPALSLTGTNWRRFGLVTQVAVLLFALSAAARPGLLQPFARVVATSGILAAAYGISQYFGWDPLIPAQQYHAGEGAFMIVRPPGTLGHAGYFATYLLFVIFLGGGLMRGDRHRGWRFAGAVAVVLSGLAIVLSGTRAALIGLLVGAVVLWMWFRPRLTGRAVAAIAAIAAAAALLYLSPAGARLRGRIHWVSEDPRGGGRLLLWKDALRMSSRHLLLGTGPETFSLAFPQHHSAELSRAYPEFRYESPHNLFLEALADQGLPGLVVLLLLIGLAAHAARRTKAPWPGFLAAALAAALASHQFTPLIMPTALLFYLTLAMLVASEQVPAARTPANSTLALPLIGFAVQLLVADHALAETRRALDAGKPREAITAYRSVLRWQPAGANSDLWYSRALWAAAPRSPNILERVQAGQQALEAAVRATKFSEERPNAWYSLAMFYAARNDFARTEQGLRAAAAGWPAWYKPHWMLARMLARADRLQEAEREAALAVELHGGSESELSATLEEIRKILQKRPNSSR